jgi:hypothetical protein
VRACKTAYHPACISAGAPFTSRRRNQVGLQFPDVRDWPNFIRKACMVRSVLGRELTATTNWELMALERMCLLDMAHYWAQGNNTTYSDKIGVLRNFGLKYGLQILRPTRLDRPPSGPEIPIMWCQAAYSLRPGHSRRHDCQDDLTLAFSTVRALRSATSQYFAWDMMVAYPSGAYLDDQQRILKQDCCPTNSLGPTFYTCGMGARIGDKARPSIALLDCHVRAINQDRNHRYLRTRFPAAGQRGKLTLGGLANRVLWLGWLGSSGTFHLAWCDAEATEPADGPLHDLPVGCGILNLQLGPETKTETKTSRTKRADACLAYETLSGYHIGKWFHRARVASGVDGDWNTILTGSFPTPTARRGPPCTFGRSFSTLLSTLSNQPAIHTSTLTPAAPETLSATSSGSSTAIAVVRAHMSPAGGGIWMTSLPESDPHPSL